MNHQGTTLAARQVTTSLQPFRLRQEGNPAKRGTNVCVKHCIGNPATPPSPVAGFRGVIGPPWWRLLFCAGRFSAQPTGAADL